ncbi:MAG: hypothetical protein ACREYF_11550 [Gammaproteobacteria bacterium]
MKYGYALAIVVAFASGVLIAFAFADRLNDRYTTTACFKMQYLSKCTTYHTSEPQSLLPNPGELQALRQALLPKPVPDPLDKYLEEDPLDKLP